MKAPNNNDIVINPYSSRFIVPTAQAVSSSEKNDHEDLKQIHTHITLSLLSEINNIQNVIVLEIVTKANLSMLKQLKALFKENDRLQAEEVAAMLYRSKKHSKKNWKE